jgi:hypothetical protein
LETRGAINEVLDDDFMGQCNFGDDCDLMMISQLMTSGTYKIR